MSDTPFAEAALKRLISAAVERGGELDEVQAHRLRKLEADLARVEADLAWATRGLTCG